MCVIIALTLACKTRTAEHIYERAHVLRDGLIECWRWYIFGGGDVGTCVRDSLFGTRIYIRERKVKIVADAWRFGAGL